MTSKTKKITLTVVGLVVVLVLIAGIKALQIVALVTAKSEALFYVPGLPELYHVSLWGKAYDTPEAAIRTLTSSLPPGARIAVIPEGPYVLAQVGQAVGT